jgi:hypothetical protein
MDGELHAFCYDEWEQWYEEGCLTQCEFDGEIRYEAKLAGRDPELHLFAVWLGLWAQWRKEQER